MLTKEQVNELFVKEFKYFFTAHSNTPLELDEGLRNIFTSDRYYNIITREVFDYDETMDIVKEIILKTLLMGASIKDSATFVEDLFKFVDNFWKTVNYKDYDIVFTGLGNKLNMTIYSKDINPKNPNKAVFVVQDSMIVHKFIKEIIDKLSDNTYKDYSIFVINSGGINNPQDFNICLNSSKMKKIMKSYALMMLSMGYK